MDYRLRRKDANGSSSLQDHPRALQLSLIASRSAVSMKGKLFCLDFVFQASLCYKNLGQITVPGIEELLCCRFVHQDISLLNYVSLLNEPTLVPTLVELEAFSVLHSQQQAALKVSSSR